MNISSAEDVSKQLPLSEGVKVVAYHPAGLVALDKPVDVLSHPNRSSEKQVSLLDARYNLNKEYYRIADDDEDEPLKKVYLLNRLDSATSGLILIGLNRDIAMTIRTLFEGHRVEKLYHAIVPGDLKTVPETWRDRIQPKIKGRTNSPFTAKKVPAAILARTAFLKEKSAGNHCNLNLIKLIPQTGRTHQLRIQCAMRGHPILGDRKYGDFALNRRAGKAIGNKRLFLHSSGLTVSFRYKGKAEKFDVKSPLPEAFNEAMRARPDLLNIPQKYHFRAALR